MYDNLFMFSAQILLFLIPGLIASAILNALHVRSKKITQLDKFFEALVFTIFILLFYIISLFISWLICLVNPSYLGGVAGGFLPIKAILEGGDIVDVDFQFGKLALLLLISIFFGLIITKVYKNGLLLRIPRRFDISKTGAQASPWQFAHSLTRENGKEDVYDVYNLIEFDDGKRVWGAVKKYSEESGHVYLVSPSKVEEGEFKPIAADGVLVNTENSVRMTYFKRKKR